MHKPSASQETVRALLPNPAKIVIQLPPQTHTSQFESQNKEVDELIQRPIIVVTAALLVVLSTQTRAQNQPTEKPKQVAVRAARLLDVKSGVLINNAVVLIEGERLFAVGPRGNSCSNHQRC